jgi:hypothetical protein
MYEQLENITVNKVTIPKNNINYDINMLIKLII